MTWTTAFPQGGTLISNFTQFITNWTYIQTTMQQDHFFNNATAGLDGHHNFVQLLNQGGTPAIAGGLSSVFYSQNFPLALAPNSPQPYFNNGQAVIPTPNQIPLMFGATQVHLNAVNSNVFSCAGLNPFMGVFTIVDVGNINNCGIAYVTFNGGGGGPRVIQLAVSGNIVAIAAGVGQGVNIQITPASIPMVVAWTQYNNPI